MLTWLVPIFSALTWTWHNYMYIKESCHSPDLLFFLWCRDVASGTDSHFDITFRLQVGESSSLVFVLFRQAFSYPYISFFHLLVNVFSVISTALSMLGWHTQLHPPKQTSSSHFYLADFRMLFINTYLYRASNMKCTITFSGLSFIAEVNIWRPLKTVVSCDLFVTRKMVPITRRASSFLFFLYTC